jgi:Domain of unknown function (DUF4398)
MIRIPWLIPAASAAFLAACGGSYPAPQSQLVNTEAQVRGAQEAGAAIEPNAALHLRLAQEAVDQGKALMRDEDNKRADYVLMRARAEAELAYTLAKRGAADADAKHAEDEVIKLRTGGK